MAMVIAFRNSNSLSLTRPKEAFVSKVRMYSLIISNFHLCRLVLQGPFSTQARVPGKPFNVTGTVLAVAGYVANGTGPNYGTSTSHARDSSIWLLRRRFMQGPICSHCPSSTLPVVSIRECDCLFSSLRLAYAV